MAQQSSTGSQNNEIFAALRDGSFAQSLESFGADELRPFLPFLMYRTLVSKVKVETSDSQTAGPRRLRARLLACPSAGDCLSWLRLEYEELRAQFADIQRGGGELPTGDYAQLPPKQRAIVIGAHFLEERFADSPPTASESFESFDVEALREEVTWITSFLCFFLPQFFRAEDVAVVLMQHANGRQILKGVVMNQPTCLEAVVERVVSLRPLDEDAALTKRRLETVTSLLRLDPVLAESFLKTSLRMDARFRICLHVLCAKNLVADRVFVNALISRLMENRSSLGAFLNKPANKELLNRIRKRFSDLLQKKAATCSKDRVVLLICALSTNNLLKVTNEPAHEYIRFLTDETGDNVRMLKLVLAVILACPNLLPLNQQMMRDEDAESKLSEFFCCIRERTRTGDAVEYASLNQFMLLVGDTLRKHVIVKRLFLANAMQEVDIAQKALSLGVTANLDQNTAGYLPVHCINQLLITRTFARNQIAIQDWIKRQIRECKTPIHGVMVEMLENFAASCFPTKDDPNFNAAIDEQFFWDLFRTELFSDDKTLAAKSLALLYLLAFTRRLDVFPRIGGEFGAKNTPTAYSERLSPFRYLAERDGRPAAGRGGVAGEPPLLRGHNHAPHAAHAEGTLDQTEEELALQEEPRFKAVPPEMLREALEGIREDPTVFTALITHLESAPIHEQHRHHETIIRAMAVSLDPAVCSLNVAWKLSRIWRRLSHLMPRKLFEETLGLWLNTSRAATNGRIAVDNAVLLKETPALLFRVDDRVFRSPPHFALLVQMLAFYLDATKNHNHVRMMKATVTDGSKGPEIEEKALLVKSYTGAQHLAVVQFLLDICDGNEDEEEQLDEIRDIACAQIHQMFIADAQLAKLVHFSMYPVNLIPMVVEKVPSAHVLIHAVPDLVVGAHLERRIFAVNLVAELARKYTIAAAISAVEFVEDLLFTLMEETNDEELIVLFLNVAEALRKIMKIGHPHDEIVAVMLQRVRNMAQSHATVYTSTLLANRSPELALVRQINEILGQ
ncbi:hypothetical protein M3Y99_01143500 [Aphelenchoides fujianensis]|nr:hypothetical protein M3Y99_01143500 [Aphelenchoides fujianensis]